MLQRVGGLARFGAAAGLVCSAAVAGGCADPASLGDVPNLAGAWAYNERITHQSNAVTCDRVGTLTFEQEGETVVGTYVRSASCIGAASTAVTESGTILQGQAVRGNLEFRVGDCQYRGAADQDSPGRLTGTVLCTPLSAPAPLQDASAGSWAADRLTEAGS